MLTRALQLQRQFSLTTTEFDACITDYIFCFW